MREIRHTKFDTPPAKPEPRQNHLAQPERRSESGEKADGEYCNEVEKDDD